MQKALLAVAVIVSLVGGGAAIFACNDQTVDPAPTAADSGPGSTAPASSCSSRCAAISVSCGSDPGECAALCASITEGELACIEDSDCSASAAAGCTMSTDAGRVDAASEGGPAGECTPLSSACLSGAECCAGAACTNKIGTSNMVCCATLGSACTGDQDCCTVHCGSAGKCCFGATVSCTTDTAASCCSGVCGASGFCSP